MALTTLARQSHLANPFSYASDFFWWKSLGANATATHLIPGWQIAFIQAIDWVPASGTDAFIGGL